MAISPPPRTPAFIHVDLDGLWTLAGAYGYPEGDSFADDPVFKTALPRLLELLRGLNIPATFFINGRDLELPDKAEAVRAAIEAGHEPACHGYAHRIGMEQLAEGEIEAELRQAVEAIEQATGRRPLGLRAPGYGAGEKILRAAARVGLRYDGSNLPTPWGPLLRLVANRLRARVERGSGIVAPLPGRHQQYAGGGRSLVPQWHDPGQRLPPILRLPVSVSPRLRLPIHASIGIAMGARRINRALTSLAHRGQPITYLLHGMDALGAEDLAGRLPQALAREPLFRFSSDQRLAFLSQVLTHLREVAKIQRTDHWFKHSSTHSMEDPPPWAIEITST